MKMSSLFNIFFTIGILIYISFSEAANPVVTLKNTKVTGMVTQLDDRTVNQYLGIPYALPPVGELRFLRPKPIENYPESIEATNQPPACPQFTENPYPWYINGTDKSEDCLYLNIWTPSDASPENKKAVLYWMHGGGFRYGSIRDELYSGVPLSALGDVVVVTVNYRLGPFGFLHSGSEHAPGNAGLWDVLLGLQWVNENIEAFGGDTSRITVSGESAGSMGTGLVTVSPLFEGLYTRLIMQSGSPSIPSPSGANGENNILFGHQLATSVGCANETYTLQEHPEEVVGCLKGVDYKDLSAADAKIMPHFSMDFTYQYGDEMLPTDPNGEVQRGNFKCRDLFIGTNLNEGSNMLSTSYPDIFGFFGEKNPQINRTLGEQIIREMCAGFPDVDALVGWYLPENQTDSDRILHQTHSAFGEWYLGCPTEYFAEKCAEQRKNVYFYQFVHRASNTPFAAWTGVAHFTEVQFVFGMPVLHPGDYQPKEVDLSKKMIQLWTNFVKFGTPEESWPLWSKGGRGYRDLEVGTCGKDLQMDSESCDFMRPYLGY